jgi:hypothetical protein
MDQITPEMLHCDVLCIYSAASLYESLCPWLSGEERTLVFIEEEEEMFLRAKQLPLAHDPKVRLFYHQKGSVELLRQIAWEFLYLKIGYFASSEEGKAFFQELSTFQTAAFTLASDWSDRGEKVVYNLLRNAHYSSLSGLSLKDACKGMPAIICGAGPSLNQAIPLLTELRDRAVIIAGGTAITALCASNVLPHFAASLDPDPPHARFLDQSCFETPFFYQSRFNAELLTTVHAQRIWMPGTGNYPLEQWLAGDPSAFDSGWTVATFCLSIAVHLGCEPILLTGTDFCAEASAIYASGIQGEEHKIHGSTYTKADWLMSAEWVAACASKCTLINTCKGQPSFEEAAVRYLQKSWDIEGYLHSILTQAPRRITDASIRVRVLQESFGKSLSLCDRLLDLWQKYFPGSPLEDPDYTLLEAQLEAEVSFPHFLRPLWDMWKAPILRKEAHPWARALHRHLFFKSTLENICKKSMN